MIRGHADRAAACRSVAVSMPIAGEASSAVTKLHAWTTFPGLRITLEWVVMQRNSSMMPPVRYYAAD